VLEKYRKQVKVAYINFPLRNHKLARPAAEAAMAAHKQGKFWEYHDAVFDIYDKLSEAKLSEIGRKVGLDMKRFEEDRRSKEVKDAVTLDLRRGKSAGVRGTPTIFVNGRLLQNRSLDGISALIDGELVK
jgi:protein-disulfide isomerase